MSEDSAAHGGHAAKQGGAGFIGFPSPLLGDAPQRLPVLACSQGLLALEVPGLIAGDAHPLNSEGAPLLAHALREQLAAGKPELERIGIRLVQSVFHLEPECSGVALFAVNREGLEYWRNAYGSRHLQFRFLLICERSEALPESIGCDLPIAQHRDGSRMLVSHKSGKKTSTQFRRLAIGGQGSDGRNPALDKELWEATTDYLRPHQIRLHAHEVGLKICGESFYDQVPPFYLSELKGQRRRPKGELPLWPAPAVHLAQISLGGAAQGAAAALSDLEREAASERAAVHGAAQGAEPEGIAPLPVTARWPRPLGLATRLLFGDESFPL